MKKEYLFIDALAMLLTKGCTIRESLELLCEYTNSTTVSHTASVVLEGLKKGNHLAEILATESVSGVRHVRPYIGMITQTGSILPALKLAMADVKRKEEYSTKMREALLYPLCVTAFASMLLALLFAVGIPWMSRSNLFPDPSIIPKMKWGVIMAASFLAISTGAAFFSSLTLLSKKNRDYLFWSLLDCLTDAGLTFDQALILSTKSAPLPCTTDADGYFFDAPELDLFTRTTLHTLHLTGDFGSVFASIATHKKKALDLLYTMLAGFAEPILLAITGVVMLILSLTVFLPALTQYGGFP